jgi:hypothetical protein
MTAFFADLAEQVPDYTPGVFGACFAQLRDRLPQSPMLPSTAATGTGGIPIPASDGADMAHRLSDEELEHHIEHCTHLLELAYERYERTGCFAARGEADRWRLARDEAVRARSPAQVARMEAQRGLD